jgi:steroid delta-isomerase-like uncharacterized protein
VSEDNKAVVRRLYEAMGAGDFETLEELIADDMVEHEEIPGFEPNKQGTLQFFKILRAAFPDLIMAPDDMVSEGHRVFVRATMTGTQQGEFMGIPATGKHIEVPVADFIRLEDGKLVEHWGITDTETMMRQLGLMES